jgi:hypothetical protein
VVEMTALEKGVIAVFVEVSSFLNVDSVEKFLQG